MGWLIVLLTNQKDYEHVNQKGTGATVGRARNCVVYRGGGGVGGRESCLLITGGFSQNT